MLKAFQLTESMSVEKACIIKCDLNLAPLNFNAVQELFPACGGGGC